MKPLTAQQFAELPWLNVSLKPHQVGDQLALASYRHGVSCVLADDAGLGKTVQAIAFLGVLTLQPRSPGAPRRLPAQRAARVAERVPQVGADVGVAAARATVRSASSSSARRSPTSRRTTSC